MSYGRWTRALFEAAASMANVARSARALRTFLNFSFLLHPSVPISLLANHANKLFRALTWKTNPMKHPSLLLTAALSLAAASAYAQAAKSSPAAGASASPSTPPTIASAIDREISLVEKEVVEAAEAMPEDKFDFSPEKLNLPGATTKVCARLASK